jgi:hypothetical protein
VQAWYQGGISMMDFTNSANPVEIGYFDRGPIDAENLVVGGFWSVYFYNGRIYGTEMVRGLDVLALLPSEYLTENEVAAAGLADHDGIFNPQQQFAVHWPADPAVALAYVDQLAGSEALAVATEAEVRAALSLAGEELSNGSRNRKLARELRSIAGTLADARGDAITARRQAELAATLEGIASRLL